MKTSPHESPSTMQPDRVRVNLTGQGYDIVIQNGLLDQVGEYLHALSKGPSVAVVTNTVVKRHHGARLVGSLRKAGFKPIVLALPDGEQTKSLKWVAAILDELVRNRFERKKWLL